jgi:hypothetical protein
MWTNLYILSSLSKSITITGWQDLTGMLTQIFQDLKARLSVGGNRGRRKMCGTRWYKV